MGKHGTKACPKCSKDMRSDNIARHLKVCGRLDVPRAPRIAKRDMDGTTLASPTNYEDLSALVKKHVKEGKLDTYLHVFYRTDVFASETSEAEFLSNFDILENIFCKCGNPSTLTDARKTNHPHAHFIGTWISAYACNKHKIASTLFTVPKAYSAKTMGKYGSITDTINLVKHFIETVTYIQTEKGWHKKTEHRNPLLLMNLKANQAFQVGIFAQWKWAQIPYMRYLAGQIEILKLKMLRSTIMSYRTKYYRQTKELQKRLENLRCEWMLEIYTTDTSLTESFNEWIQTL